MNYDSYVHGILNAFNLVLEVLNSVTSEYAIIFKVQDWSKEILVKSITKVFLSWQCHFQGYKVTAFFKLHWMFFFVIIKCFALNYDTV